MNDLISKRAVLAKINLWANGGCDTDKLIESIKKMSGGSLTDRPCEYCKNHVDGRCAAWDCAFDDVLSSSENPNKSEIMTDWIPVSERLPEDKTYVLTTIKVPNRIAHARSSWYEGGFFHNDNGDTWRATDMEVKAWMPLPEPYKAEGSEE